MTCDPELLLAFLDGELSAEAEADLARHLADCVACRQTLASLRQSESGLSALAAAAPASESLAQVQRRVRQELGMVREREILTIEEAADFLRLQPDELAAVLDDLPWFELAGQIRFRREALVDWVRERERECSRERCRRNLQRELRIVSA